MRGLRAGFTFVIALLAIAANAQTSTPAQTQNQDERIRALEDRIIALEGQVRMLQQQTQAQRPAAPPATPAEQQAAAQQAAGVQPQPPIPVAQPAGGGELQGQIGGATSMAKALNPDISVIGDFIGALGHNPFAQEPAFQMHESEVGFQAIIDPYARGDFFISFGEEGVNLEEGYITLTALPGGIVARAGKMRGAFGKVNTLHNHVLSWIDRPLVANNLTGGEDGINDAGLSFTRSFSGPKQVFLEATGQVFRGDSADVFKSSRRSDVSTVLHFRGYRDITESTNIDIGGSYSRGHNDLGTNFLTQLYGVDTTLRWKPLRRSIYHSFVGRGEFVWSLRDQLPMKQRAFGFYTSGDYQLARRWFVGARYDRSDRARNASITDSGTSLVLTYWPSEFSQVRGQYRYTNYGDGLKAHEALMQFIYVLGAHGAHPF